MCLSLLRRIIGSRETRRYPDTFGCPTNESVAKLCEGYSRNPRPQGMWEKMQFFFGLRTSDSQEERRVGRGRGGGQEEKEEGRRRGRRQQQLLPANPSITYLSLWGPDLLTFLLGLFSCYSLSYLLSSISSCLSNSTLMGFCTVRLLCPELSFLSVNSCLPTSQLTENVF